jgi:hypothetical protein
MTMPIDQPDRGEVPRSRKDVCRVVHRSPKTGEGCGTLAEVTAERIPARLPGGQRACSLTPLVMLMLLCFLFPSRLHFQPAICTDSS